MSRDIVIVSEGGMMMGIFGGGVVTAFQEHNLYERIHSIYAVSAGAHNAAYFLSQQTRLASSIYYDDLSGDRFIKRRRLLRSFGHLLGSRLRGVSPRYPIIDLDYLQSIERDHKPIDEAAIREQPIAFNICVFNTDTLGWEWLDGKQHTLELLKASSAAAPYYPWPVTINGRHYLDGDVVRSDVLLRVIKRHSDKKILYIINASPRRYRDRQRAYYRWLESNALGLLYDRALGSMHAKSACMVPTYEHLSSFPHVRIIANQKQYLGTETRRERLLEVYHHGIARGQAALMRL